MAALTDLESGFISERKQTPISGPPRVLLFPPATPGSLGDDAMLLATVSYLRALDVHDIGLVSYDRSKPWSISASVDTVMDVREYMDDGAISPLVQLGEFAATYTHAFAVGADVLDGYYSEDRTLRRIWFARLCAATGLKTTILGFSLNQSPTERAVKALRELPLSVQLNARDPISRQRLEARLRRPVRGVADIAFLLPAAQSLTSCAEDAMRVIEKNRACGRTIMGMNVNSLVTARPNSEFEASIATATSTLLNSNPDLFVLFVPHDRRAATNDELLAERVSALLPDEHRSRCHVVRGSVPAPDIKALAAHLDVAVSCRMHFAIACLGTGLPVGCLDYQGKFEGLFQHFGLENSVLDVQEDIDSKRISMFMQQLLEERHTRRRQVEERLPDVMRLAKSNFDAVCLNEGVNA